MKCRFRTIVSAVLCMAVMISLLSCVGSSVLAAGSSGQCGEHLTWSYSSGTLRISGTGDMTVYGNFRNIPWRSFRAQISSLILENGITSISEQAFEDFGLLTSVVIPDSVIRIGNNAFGHCSVLKTVRLGKNLKSIGADAFHSCRSLTEIVLPNGLTELGNNAFYDSGLRGVTIPGSVKYIGERAFSYCKDLTNVQLLDGVENIGTLAFHTTGLKTVSIPKSVTNVEAGAFSDCPALGSIRVDAENPAYYSDKNGILYSKDRTALVQIPMTISGYLSIPNSVTRILGYAFSGCKALVGASIPGGITELEDYALYGWTGVRDLILPEGLERIGTFAMGYCSNLRTLYIPDSVRVIDRCAFYNCASLVEIRIPSGITQLGQKSLAGCHSLYSMVVPSSLTGLSNTMDGVCQKLQHFLYLGYWSQWDAFRNNMPYQIMNRAIAHTNKSAADLASRDSLYWGYSNTGKYLYCTECGKILLDLPFEAADNPFRDVQIKDYSFASILWALEQGITTGTSKDNFAPQQECTRGQIVTFLWRACGSPEPESTENPFADVAETAYYYKAVLWAVEKGITTGMNATTFAPDKSCTRGQAVTFLWRAKGKAEAGNTEDPFTDVAETDFFFEPVLWALEEGVTTGVTATTFAPGKTCTRGQIVTFLFRAMNQRS